MPREAMVVASGWRGLGRAPTDCEDIRAAAAAKGCATLNGRDSFMKNLKSVVGLALRGAIVLISVPTALASPIGTPLGPVMPVTEDLSQFREPGAAVIAGDRLGRYVVAFRKEGDLLARCFEADGTPRGATLPVATPDGRDTAFQAIAVSSNSNGEFVIAYTREDPSYSGRDLIEVQFFNSGCAKRGTPVAVVRTPDPKLLIRSQQYLSDPAVAIDESGEAVVSWQTTQSFANQGQFYLTVGDLLFGGIDSRVQLQRLSRDGGLIGGPVLVAQRQSPSLPQGSLYPETVLAGNPRGGFAIGYRNPNMATDLGLGSPFRVKLFDAQGRESLLPTPLSIAGDRAPKPEDDYGVAFDGSGNLVLAWTTAEPMPLLQRPKRELIFVRRYSPLGVPLGPPTQVAARAIGFHRLPSLQLAATPSGGFVIAWPDAPLTFPRPISGQSFARYYAADGSPVGDVFAFNDNAHDLGATTDAQGHLLAVWNTGRTIDNQYAIDPPDLFVRRFQGP